MQSFREKFNRKKQQGSTTIPYSAPFIQFIDESREQQTLLANLAGNSMPEFSITNRKPLEDFLSVSLYHSKLSEGRKNYEEHGQQEEIQKIADRIFESFHGVDTVQVTLVWIFCYSPDEQQTKYLPVFLIKSPDGVRSTYMDITFRYFNTLNNIIENVPVEKSFLCFPREGKYQSKECVLDLEFMWSRTIRTVYKVSRVIKIYVPFCISYVKNWVTDKIQSLGKTVSETWTRAIEFYKAHSSEINFTIHIILIIATACINPSSTWKELTSLLKPMLKPYVQTNDGTDSTCIVDPRSQQEFLNKFENTCNNTVTLSQLCMNAFKNQTSPNDITPLIEKLSCIIRDVKAMSNNKIVCSLLEKITKITIKESEKHLENVRNDVPIGNVLAETRNLSECISNNKYEKYIIHIYNGSDFTEAEKAALHLFKRDLKLKKKSNKLFDCSENLLGYIYFLQNVTVCVFLKSEIQFNESGNYTFTIIEN